jgi:hypothetical protein
MTYYNIVLRAGHRRMARTLADAGIAAAIVPDLPIDELNGWGDEALAAGVESVLLVAPTTPDSRLKAICARSRGFVYGVGVMGVTGERAALSATALAVAARCKAETDTPGAHRRRGLHSRAGAGGRHGGRRGGDRICARAPPARRRRDRTGRPSVRGGVPGSDRQLSGRSVRRLLAGRWPCSTADQVLKITNWSPTRAAWSKSVLSSWCERGHTRGRTGRVGHRSAGRQVPVPSSRAGSRNASANDWPSTASTWPSPPDRSPDSWVRTGPGRPPPSGCCSA